MKIMTILGTRPEGIKMAPVIRRLRNDPEIDCVSVNTAQHREMLDQVLQLFEMVPDYDLNLMRTGQSVDELISTLVAKTSQVIDIEKPDLVLVNGDTTTTFVG